MSDPKRVRLAQRYKESYTRSMKTAISLPDDLYRRGEAYAERRALSRSELYARALETYLEANEAPSITAALNDLYADEDSALSPQVDALALEGLRQGAWRR